jgi:hypothetical protein
MRSCVRLMIFCWTVFFVTSVFALDVVVVVPLGGVKCSEGQTLCNGQCVNLQTDGAHCGTCTSECGDGDICTYGACVPFPP